MLFTVCICNYASGNIIGKWSIPKKNKQTNKKQNKKQKQNKTKKQKQKSFQYDINVLIKPCI